MLLLLFNSSVQGTSAWTGPSPLRTAFVEPEVRVVMISAS